MRPARVITPSPYFEKKYGTATPEVQIECTDFEAWGKSWTVMNGNPAAMLYGMRAGMESKPFTGTVYYGKIGSMGECFHESELEFLDGEKSA